MPLARPTAQAVVPPTTQAPLPPPARETTTIEDEEMQDELSKIESDMMDVIQKYAEEDDDFEGEIPLNPQHN